MVCLGSNLGDQFMKTVATVNVVIFAIVCAVAVYLGVDPKKWQTWLLSLYAFMTFFLVAIVGKGDVYEAIKIGAIVTFALIFGGILTYWNRERAKRWLNEHNENEE